MTANNKRKVHPLEPRIYFVIGVEQDEKGAPEYTTTIAPIPVAIYDKLIERMTAANKILADAFENGEMNASTEIQILESLKGDSPVERITVDDNMPIIPEKKHDIMYG